MRDEVKLTCSVGVGPNRLLSKVAADINKPDGQYVVPPDLPSIKRFVATLPIRKVPGIGKVSQDDLTMFPLLLKPCFHLQGPPDLVSSTSHRMA